jgi:Mut7-C RNAse domain
VGRACWEGGQAGGRDPFRGGLAGVPRRVTGRADVEKLLPGGTRRPYQAFSRCGTSGRIYWRGAHSKRLVPIVESAIRAAAVTDRGCDQ